MVGGAVVAISGFLALVTGLAAGIPRTMTAASGKPPESGAAEDRVERGPAERPAPGAPAAPSRAAPPRLDLATLEQRLRETSAIGLFTKLTLKNQVDDLLQQFRQYHNGRRTDVLAHLRERFDLLLMKVLTLLQNRDPALARDIASSREALWTLLLDPRTFARRPTGGRAYT